MSFLLIWTGEKIEKSFELNIFTCRSDHDVETENGLKKWLFLKGACEEGGFVIAGILERISALGFVLKTLQ